MSIFRTLLLSLSIAYSFSSLQADLTEYLLPENHPLQEQLSTLFNDPKMFRSPNRFKNAGFDVKLGHFKLMVGAHPSIPEHLCKKFSDNQSQSYQIKNYIKRIKGAAVIKEYIEKHNFKHLVVPEKWLYPLPSFFSKNRTYVLIVEKMDIYTDWDEPDGIARELYYNMDIEILTELCTILHDIGGCDGYPRNQPFTRSGQIAFVDTEHVGKYKGHFKKHIVPALNPDLQRYALDLWEKLERH